MKKLILLVLSVLLIMSMAVSVMADEVGQYGVIEKYYDIVTPNGDNANVNTKIEGLTDVNGDLAIPKAEDSKIENIKVIEGSLSKDIERIDIGETSYYLLSFKETSSKVVVDIKQVVEGVYELKKAKLKKTFPGKVKKVSYELQNTAPITIDDYKCDMVVTSGYELFNIVDYDAEENFEIFEKDGIKYGSNHIVKIKSGESFKITLNLIPENNYNPFIIWTFVILVSTYSLYKNKDILIKAKEMSLKNKNLIEGKENA